MEVVLEILSKEDLLKVVSNRDEWIAGLSKDSLRNTEELYYLKSQLAVYRHMRFGQKGERFDLYYNRKLKYYLYALEGIF